ncbi:hypothetical protein [Gemmatimonas sp.]|uniref:hypothetical protein n=1 Tax=Gemmatimonas sp. TaxID=1962908 RepID=UPI0039838D70
MSRAPSLWHWVLAGAVLSLAGVGFDAVRVVPTRTLRTAMRPFLHVSSTRPNSPTVLHAAVLLQLSDCSGNLRMLHVLHRGRSREQIHLAVIWYVGPTDDSLAIRSELPAWTSPIPLRPAPAVVVRQFAELGHTTTPALLVLDQEGRVRFTTQSPRSSREVAGLRRIVEGLTWIEEL